MDTNILLGILYDTALLKILIYTVIIASVSNVVLRIIARRFIVTGKIKKGHLFFKIANIILIVTLLFLGYKIATYYSVNFDYIDSPNAPDLTTVGASIDE
jgi:hypothetical protein